MTDTTVAPVLDRAQFGREWEAWHRAHEARRTDPHGFLAVTGLYWLRDEPQQIPGVPGSWTTGPGGPVVQLDDDEQLTLGDAALIGRHDFGVIPERGGVTVAFEGGVVRDRQARWTRHRPAAASRSPVPRRVRRHADLRAEPDLARAVRPSSSTPCRGRPRSARPSTGSPMSTTLPATSSSALRGETFRLVAFPGHAPGELLVLFSDATSGLTTYAANRSVSVAAPDADGATVIDFNRAVNLPCAYTDFATCPLPPAENRLPVAIEAGEKTPLSRVNAHEAVGAPT